MIYSLFYIRCSCDVLIITRVCFKIIDFPVGAEFVPSEDTSFFCYRKKNKPAFCRITKKGSTSKK